MKIKKAMLIVDVQNDFCPGGALGVPQGDKIVPVINKYIRVFSKKKYHIFATRDWHPVRTVHFKDFGGLWPVHCLANTPGARFHPALKLPKDAILLYKGMNPEEDSYSAFWAQDSRGVSLYKLLQIMSINELYIAGLATDYCVKFTSLDALKHGFKVKILIDAVKGVDLKPLDSSNALKEIVKKGAKQIKLADLKR